MDRTFQVTYTSQLIRSATAHFWRQSGGLRNLLWGVVVFAAFLVYMILSGDRTVWAGSILGVFGVNVLLTVLRYHVYRSAAAEKLRKMGSPDATIRFTDESIGMQSGMGFAEMPWRTVEQVWTFADVWLVFIGKGGYFTLPTASMDDEAQAFITQMVTQNGGKVR
jgi:hypothetical protein